MQSNLSLERRRPAPLVFSVATRRPASTSGGHEYRQKGGFSALLEVHVVPREAPRERNGARSRPKAESDVIPLEPRRTLGKEARSHPEIPSPLRSAALHAPASYALSLDG